MPGLCEKVNTEMAFEAISGRGKSYMSQFDRTRQSHSIFWSVIIDKLAFIHRTRSRSILDAGKLLIAFNAAVMYLKNAMQNMHFVCYLALLCFLEYTD